MSTPQSASEKRKAGSHTKPHLSLSSSITNKNIKGIDFTLSPSFNQEANKDQTSIYQFNAKTMAS